MPRAKCRQGKHWLGLNFKGRHSQTDLFLPSLCFWRASKFFTPTLDVSRWSALVIPNMGGNVFKATSPGGLTTGAVKLLENVLLLVAGVLVELAQAAVVPAVAAAHRALGNATAGRRADALG